MLDQFWGRKGLLAKDWVLLPGCSWPAPCGVAQQVLHCDELCPWAHRVVEQTPENLREHLRLQTDLFLAEKFLYSVLRQSF